MSSTKYIIKADVSNALSNLEKLKAQYRSTLQSIIQNQKLINEIDKKIAREKALQVDLKPRSAEMKAAKEREAALRKEKALLIATKQELKSELEYIKLKTLQENENLKIAKEQLNVAKRIKSEQQDLQALKDKLLINSPKEQIQRKYAGYIDEVRRLREKGIISIYEQQKAIKNLNEAQRQELINNKSLTNQIVRHIRQIESFVVAIYGLHKIYQSTLGVGHEFNKLVENETIGLKLLIAQNLKNVDIQGKSVTLTQKYAQAQLQAAEALKIVRKINLETPQTFAETAQIYKLILPQVVKYGASLKDVGEITKKTAIVAKAMGVEFQQLLMTVDSIFTGEAKESGLRRAFAQFGLTQEAIKKAKETGKLVDLIKEKLSNIDPVKLGILSSWDNAMGRFKNAWQDLWGTVQKPMFDSMKQELVKLSEYINKNKDDIAVFLLSTAKDIQAILPTMAQMLKMWILYNTQLKLSATLSGLAYGGVLNWAKAARLGIAGAVLGMAYMNDETSSLSGTIKRFFQYFNLGFATVKFGFFKLVSAFEQGIMWIVNGFKKVGLGIKNIFLGAFNSVIDVYNSFMKKLFSNEAVNKINDYLRVFGVNKTLKAGFAEIDKIKIQTKIKPFKFDTKWTDTNLKNAYEDMLKAYVQTKTPIKNTQSEVKKILEQQKKLNAENKKYQIAWKKNKEEAGKASKKNKKNIKDGKKRYNQLKRNALQHTKINQELNKQKSLLKQIEDLKKNWFKFDKDAVKTAREKWELAKKQVETTKALKKFDRAKYEKAVTNELKARLKYLQAEHKQLEAIYNIYKGGIGQIFKGDFKSGLESIFTGFRDKLIQPLVSEISSYLTKTTSSWFSGLGSIESGLLGIGLGLIPNIFSSIFSGHKLTEEEIKIAKGRVEFTDESLSKLAGYLEKANNPLLPYTRKMTEYLASLNKNFLVLGRALSTNATFDYTGVNYKPHGGSFLGWGSSYEKIGSGIALNNIDFKTGSVSGYGYLTEKVHESSWFGLVQDEYVKETTKALDSSIKSIIQKSIIGGKKIILDSSKILGYNVEDALNKVKISLGKINLDGLSSEEISKRLNNALSEVFSKAIAQLGDVNKLVDKYAEAGEEQLATLSRIAIEYEQASDLLKNINFDLTDTVKYKTQRWFLGLFTEIKKQVYTVQEKVLDIVKFSGGLDKFTENYNSFFNNYYTDAEKLKVYRNTLKQQFSSLGVTLPNTKEEFRNLIETFKVTDEATAKTYAELLKLSDAYNSFADMQEKLRKEQLDKEKERLQKLLDWNKQILSKLEDFWDGSLSYLNSTEKAAKLQEIANLKIQQGDVVGYLETQQKALEFEKKIARTREEYALKADRYVYDLQKAKPDTTLKDVVKSIEELKAENAKIREEIVEMGNNTISNETKLLKDLIEINKEQVQELKDTGVVR